MGSSSRPQAQDIPTSKSSFSIGGRPLATTTVGKGGSKTNIDLGGANGALDLANTGITTALGQLGNIGVSDADRAGYANELFQPVANTINQAFDLQGNAATQRFNSAGGLNSVGYNRYQLGTVEKNRATALASAQNTANTQSYNLPSLKMQPILQMLSAYGGTQNNIINQALALAGQSGNGANQAAQWNQAQYQVDMQNQANQSNGGALGWYGKFIDPLDFFKSL